MASIRKRPNDRWRARYRDADGQEHARHFDRKIDAQRWLDEVTASIVTGQYVHPRAGDITFQEYAESWRAIAGHRKSTADLVRRHFANHVYPAIGSKRLKNITPSDIRALDAALAETLAPATIVVIHRYVSAVLAAAVRDRKIATSPSSLVPAPRVARRKVSPISTELVLRLRDLMPDRYQAVVITAAGTGMRQGEVFGLTLDRINFLQRTVAVDRQLVSVAGELPRFAELKTAASEREIPLPGTVIDALTQHLDVYPPGPEGLVFTNTDGGPLRRSAFNDAWTKARHVAMTAWIWLDAPPQSRTRTVAHTLGVSAQRAGLLVAQARGAGLLPGVSATPEQLEAARTALGERPRRTVVFHDLRHYYASLLIRHGASVKAVQARLGHKSASETLDTYSHLWPDDDDRTRGAVDAVLGGAPGVVLPLHPGAVA